MVGSGREFSIFDSRGGSSGSESSDNDDDDEFGSSLERYRRTRMSRYTNLYSDGGRRRSKPPKSPPKFVQNVQEWWSTSVSPHIQNLPKMVCRIEPTTTLKLRKTFRPLKTVVRIGADFNSQLGVWQFKSSWEDDIIGGKLTLAGKELQVTKSWQLSVGKKTKKM